MVDVRAVLDGKVWPTDPHDFVGDEMDILDEQVAQVPAGQRADVARELLKLCFDSDRVIRSLAVGALSSVHEGISTADLCAVERRAGPLLDVPIATRNRLTGPQIRDELQLRILESARWSQMHP